MWPDRRAHAEAALAGGHRPPHHEPVPVIIKCIYIYVYVCICMHVCVCICIYIYIYICNLERYACVSLSLYIYTQYIYIYIFIYLYIIVVHEPAPRLEDVQRALLPRQRHHADEDGEPVLHHSMEHYNIVYYLYSIV